MLFAIQEDPDERWSASAGYMKGALVYGSVVKCGAQECTVYCYDDKANATVDNIALTTPTDQQTVVHF